jgi:hypothetical protein
LLSSPAGPSPSSPPPVPLRELDLSRLKWLDDPNGLSLTAHLPGMPPIKVMGDGTQTPYNASWQDTDGLNALYAQLGGITVTNGVASLPATPASPPVVTPAPAAPVP